MGGRKSINHRDCIERKSAKRGDVKYGEVGTPQWPQNKLKSKDADPDLFSPDPDPTVRWLSKVV